MTEQQIITYLLMGGMFLLALIYVGLQVMKTAVGLFATKAPAAAPTVPAVAAANAGKPVWLPIANLPAAVSEAKPPSPKTAPEKPDEIAEYTTVCGWLRRVELYVQARHGDDDAIVKAVDTLLLKMHQKPITASSSTITSDTTKS